MSDTVFTDVTTIGLNSSNYGEEINKRFETIDHNFSLIDKMEYWKGAPGDSINVYECEFSSPESPDANTSVYDGGFIYTESGDRVTKGLLYEMIVNAITYGIPEYGLKKIYEGSTVNWYDNFDKMNKILLICQNIKGKDIVVSSMPYSYIDARFTNIDWEHKDDYANAYDVSSYLGWDASSNSIVKLNQGQTLYYNSEIETFCWVINGTKTNIPANGAQGESGHNGIVYIVQPEQTNDGQDVAPDDNGYVVISKVFMFKDDKYTFVPLNESGIEFLEGDSAICFYTEYRDGEATTYFVISPLHYDAENGYWQVVKDLSNSITTIYNTQVLKTALLTLSTSQVLPGLFIPASNQDSDGVIMGHMMWVDDENLNNNSQKAVKVALVENVAGSNEPTPYEGDIESHMYLYYDVHVDGSLDANSIKIGDPSGEYMEISPSTISTKGFVFADNNLKVGTDDTSSDFDVTGSISVGKDANISNNVNIGANLTTSGYTTLESVKINGSIINDQYHKVVKNLEWLGSYESVKTSGGQSTSTAPTLSIFAHDMFIDAPNDEGYYLKWPTKTTLDDKRNAIYAPGVLGKLKFNVYIEGEFEMCPNGYKWFHNGREVSSHQELSGYIRCIWNGSTLYTFK